MPPGGPFAVPAAGRRPWDALCLGLNAAGNLCLTPRFPRRGGKLRVSAFAAMGGGLTAISVTALGGRGALAGRDELEAFLDARAS